MFYSVPTTDNERYNTIIQFYVKEEFDNDKQPIPDFKGEVGELRVIYKRDENDTISETMICVGAGEGSDDEYRSASIVAIREATKLERRDVCVWVEPHKSIPIAEGIFGGVYSFDTHKSKENRVYPVNSVDFLGSTVRLDIERTEELMKAVAYTRDLQNENAGIVTPEYLVEEAQEIANYYPDACDIEILYEDNIKNKGLNLLWAVGQGSPTPPRLIIVHYKGAENSDYNYTLVGKGVTFDSGGLSLKPSASMVDMKTDMSGGAVVLGTLKYLVETQAEVNVIAVVPCAHNAIGSDVFYLGDTIQSYSGKSVEIHNTDAEGRLILADAISYVIKNYDVDEIVDIATLTGAVTVALGDTIAGTFSNDDVLADKIFNAGEAVGERVWRMPIRDEHRKAVKGKVGDLRNISNIGRNAGSITASAFLENFVEDKPWCHIDIAGTSRSDAEGSTGWGVRLLAKYLGV